MPKRVTQQGKKGRESSMKDQNEPSVRASISFPPDLYESLEGLAKQKKVSLAWVVRDAAERYVAGETTDAARSERVDGKAQGIARRTS